MPHKTSSLKAINRTLDRSAMKFNARKMLYSYCYYSPEEFWNIYPADAYEQLQRRYHAKESWTSIYEKISQQSGF
jgi:hypothetical protein